MATQRILEMDFNTELGKSQRIRVYDAKETLTGTEVAAAMDLIIAKNIFSGTGGNLISKTGAQVVVTDTSEITLV